MKEIVGNACNTTLVEQEDGQLMAFGEIVLIVSEPQWKCDLAGQLVRERGVEQMRFGGTARTLRELSKNLADYADALAELEAKHNGG